MDLDGISISTAAISALLGGGGLGALAMRIWGARRCEHCPDHHAFDTEVRRTGERIAAMQSDIRNICRSLDELRDDLRAMRGAVPPVQFPRN